MAKFGQLLLQWLLKKKVSMVLEKTTFKGINQALDQSKHDNFFANKNNQ